MPNQHTANTLCHFLLQAAERYPDTVAVVDDEVVISYATLAGRALRVAKLLGTLLEPGARVTMLMDNSPDYVSVYWGILLAGATSVELNPALSHAELHRQMQWADASLHIASHAYSLELNRFDSARTSGSLAMAGPTWPAVPHALVAEIAAVLSDNDPGTLPAVTKLPDPQSLASIVFTSGTTGEVKGVELTHANLAWTTKAIIESFCIDRRDEGEVFSGLLPLYYTYGKSGLHLATQLASSVVFSNRFPSPRNLVTLFREFRVTHVSLVPYQCHALLKRDDFCTEALPHIARVTVAGGGIDATVRGELERRFPGSLFVMYGLTEASTRVSCLSHAGIHPATSCGQPLRDVEIRIEPLEQPTGDNPTGGQILVRGPNVMRGYFRDPEATHYVMKDGWLCTGDLGYLDADGALHVTGRMKEIIKVMGESIAASTVETAIRALPEVADVAVVGARHPDMGEVIHAYVCLHAEDTLTPEQVRRQCAESLGRVRTPSQVYFVDELPRTASGKVRKHLLAAS